MGAAYHVMGKAIPPHQLAIGTLGLLSLLVVPNPFKSAKPKTVDITTDNKDEERFIKNYLKEHSEKQEA
ncbi:atp19p [Saccharomyces arboricola H-6]|uniref:Atp19p n=1 Tax=Saccharomyces arboricola (strain H-6 / AS 2.3317 / CBS 10644) TaxID=1160507 RepID=J8PZK8_SACAR|nr:atp19p [Saccharomyces arboricola H-6]